MASVPSVGGMILATAGVLLTFFLVRGIYRAFFHPLAKVPGPKLWAFTDIFFAYYTLRGLWPYKVKELHDKYGPVVRTTPKDVSFIKPGAWKTIYGHRGNQDVFIKDPRFYRPSVSGHHHIVSAQGDDHKRHRKLLGYAFSEKAVRAQEDVIQGYVTLMIQKLTERAKTSGMADMVQWFNFITFDLVGDLAFGEAFGNMEKGEYHSWVSKLFESLQGMAISLVLARYPGLARLVPKRFSEARKHHWDLANSTTRKRIEGGSLSREDFMSYILRYNEADKKGGLSVEEIVENSYILVVAGSETTGTLLAGTLYHLLMNIDKYEKLVTEVRSSFKKEGDIISSSVLDLPYMTAVIEEAMRICEGNQCGTKRRHRVVIDTLETDPPIPVALPRLTPSKGEFVEGYWIPGGVSVDEGWRGISKQMANQREKTGVGIAQWAALHSESNFCDPFKFAPERWMGDPAYQHDIRDAMQGFSLGPRNCLGRRYVNTAVTFFLDRFCVN